MALTRKFLRAMGFNPRAREGRDDSTLADEVFEGVSIHAPARGATCVAAHSTNPCGVSIHAPARGATTIPRHPAPSLVVSIHAPARGATQTSFLTSLHIRCFNPRAREGRDACSPSILYRAGRFNPRAREGRDMPKALH